MPAMLAQISAAVNLLDPKTASWIRVQQNRYNRKDQAKQVNEEKLEKYEKKLKAIDS